MKKLFLIVFILFSTSFAYSQHLFVQTLDSVATITFPDTPKVQTEATYRIYMTNKAGIAYLAEVSPVQPSLRDMLSKDNLDTTYNGFLKGLLESSHGKLLYKKNITIHDLDGVEFGCESIVKDQKYYTYGRVVFFNNTLINYSVFSILPLNKTDKQLTSFFNTFKVTIAKDDVRQSGADELAYHTGIFIGRLLAFTLLCAIIGVIVFAAIKISRKLP